MSLKVKANQSLAGEVPGSVWRQGSFYWSPTAFVVESERLDGRIIEASAQENSVNRFYEKPASAYNYVVTGNPDDSKAKYFAAYLVSLHKKHLGVKANVVWETVYGGFSNPLMDKSISPTMLVLSNVTAESTAVKLEKVRDLIERFPNCMKVVVGAGEDPISFASLRLRIPVHGIAYFASKHVKQVQTVI
jgi:tricorn protease-like protein